MKILYILLLSCTVTFGQNVAVKFYGATNTFGLPAYWVKVIQENTNNVSAGFIVMDTNTLNSIILTNQSLYAAWELNKINEAAAKAEANRARLIELFAKLPAARAQLASIQSTNLNSGPVLRAAVVTEASVLDDIFELLQRLESELKVLYKPAEQTTQ